MPSDTSNILKDFGFPAMFLLLVTKMIFDFISRQKQSVAEMKNEKARNEISEGAYRDMKIESAIDQLSKNMIRQTALLERMVDDHKDMGTAVTRIEANIDRLNLR